MVRSRRQDKFQKMDALDIIAMEETFDSNSLNYQAVIQRLLKQIEDARAKQRTAEAEYETNHKKALQSLVMKFLNEVKLGFSERALIFGAILQVKKAADSSADSGLIQACYACYDAYVKDESNSWKDMNYLPLAED